MNNLKLVMSLIICALLSLTSLGNVIAAVNTDDSERARDFVERLKQQDFEGAVQYFGDPLNHSLPADQLKQKWQAVLSKRGAFEKIVRVEAGKDESYNGTTYKVINVICKFEQSTLNIRLSFDAEHRVTSLWFVPRKR
jgi:Protein of unknown function (DUF3887)